MNAVLRRMKKSELFTLLVRMQNGVPTSLHPLPTFSVGLTFSFFFLEGGGLHTMESLDIYNADIYSQFVSCLLFLFTVAFL